MLNPEPGGFAANRDESGWLVVMLPSDTDTAVCAWQVCDGKAVSLEQLPLGTAAAPPEATRPVVALASPQDCVLRWIALEPGLTQRQAEAAARLEVQTSSLSGAGDLHVVASREGDGDVLTASIASSRLASGISRLAHAGLEPVSVVPAGLLLAEPKAGLHRAVLGGLPLLRGKRLCLPDEQGLKVVLAPHLVVEDLSGEACLAAISRAVSPEAFNLRTGAFARRLSFPPVTASQRRKLALAVSIGLALAFAVPLTQLAKLKIATRSEEKAAAQLELGSEARRGGEFGTIAAALLLELRSSPEVTLAGLSHQNGTTVAKLNAVQGAAEALARRLTQRGFRADVRVARGGVELVVTP